MVRISIDGRQLAKLQRTLQRVEKDVPRVLAPAINRALDKGRTVVKREIRKQYVIKAKDIPVTVSGATVAKLGGAVTVRQGMLPLNKFRFRPRAPSSLMRRKRPVFVQVKRGRGGFIAHAFVPAGINYIGPFIRVAGAARLPIKKLMTIGASIMASQPDVGPKVQKAMGDTLAKRIDHEMERVLARSHK